MPANFISAALAWFATHLVLFSLLGFLLAGLFVAGVIGPVQIGSAAGRSGAPATTAEPNDPDTTPARPDRPRPAGGRKPEGAKTDLSKDVVGTTPVPAGQAHKPPRLIGGSVPIYDPSGSASWKAGPLPGDGDGSFRPSGEGERPPGPAAGTRDHLLQDARRAFWSGDLEKAEAGYMALLAAFPGDADAFGELGNLYQAMGMPEMALDAYYEAALRLRAAGERERLEEMVELLRREGDERAERLTD